MTKRTFSLGFNFLMNRPKAMATKMNNMEMEAAAALGRTMEPSLAKPLNVVATISPKAAMTSRLKTQQKSRNRRRPVVPIYFSMRTPIDLPSFFMDA